MLPPGLKAKLSTTHEAKKISTFYGYVLFLFGVNSIKKIQWSLKAIYFHAPNNLCFELMRNNYKNWYLLISKQNFSNQNLAESNIKRVKMYLHFLT